MTNKKYKVGENYIHQSRYNSSEIAKEILSQLRSQPLLLLSWEANSFISVEDGLLFLVNSNKFTGEVLIILKPTDTYTVLFGKRNKEQEWIIQEYFEDIYCNNLINVINSYINHD